MSGKPPSSRRPAFRYGIALWAGTWPTFTIGALVAVVLLGAGCDTPYTKRVRQLDDAYQQGDLSREDYMRFVHDAERWEGR